MICIISPTLNQATKFAHTQSLSPHEWFYLSDKADVMSRTNFHVLVIGEFPQERLSWFESVYRLAKTYGNKK